LAHFESVASYIRLKHLKHSNKQTLDEKHSHAGAAVISFFRIGIHREKNTFALHTYTVHLTPKSIISK